MELIINQNLQQAIFELEQGRTEEAKKIFLEALKLQHDDPESLYYLAVIAIIQNKIPVALSCFEKAISQNVMQEKYWKGYVEALISDYQLENVEKALEIIKEFGFDEDWRASVAKRLDEMKNKRFNADLPKLDDPFNHQVNYLRHLIKCSNYENALLIGKKIAKKFSKCPEIFHLLGLINYQLDLFEDAMDAYREVIKLQPDNERAHSSLAAVQKQSMEYEEATKSYKRLISLNPHLKENYFNLANSLNFLEKKEDALSIFKRCTIVDVCLTEAHYNIGNILNELGKYEEAIASYEKAIKLNPVYMDAYNNLGNTLNDAGDLNAALECYGKALKIDPHDAATHTNQSFVYLAQKDFQRGWREYEWRWGTKQFGNLVIKSNKPKWNLEKYERVLLWADQGIGDVIMFSSMIPELYLRSEKLIIQVDERLIPLFSRSFQPDIIYYSKRIEVPEDLYDSHTSFGSLPLYLRQKFNNFSETSGCYLKVDEQVSSELRKQIIKNDGDIVVGVTWKGGSFLQTKAKNKSIELGRIAQLIKKKNVKLIDLQYGDTKPERDALRMDAGIYLYNVPEIDNYNDIDSLASLINACDHIISVDNLTVHLAGGLGKETSVLLPFASDWRWGENHKSSYWHSSLKLFRQERVSDWEAPLKKLELELSNLTNTYNKDNTIK